MEKIKKPTNLDENKQLNISIRIFVQMYHFHHIVREAPKFNKIVIKNEPTKIHIEFLKLLE